MAKLSNNIFADLTHVCGAIGNGCADLVVKLRYMEPSDVQALFFMENDPLNWVYSERSDAPFSMEEIEKFVLCAPRDLITDGQLRFVVDLDGQVAGAIDLYDYDPSNREAWVGVIIYPDRFRKHGIARQALEQLAWLGFHEFNLTGLYACVMAHNEPSVKLFRSCGFALCDLDSANDDVLTKKIYYRGLSY